MDRIKGSNNEQYSTQTSNIGDPLPCLGPKAHGEEIKLGVQLSHHGGKDALWESWREFSCQKTQCRNPNASETQQARTPWVTLGVSHIEPREGQRKQMAVGRWGYEQKKMSILTNLIYRCNGINIPTDTKAMNPLKRKLQKQFNLQHQKE